MINKYAIIENNLVANITKTTEEFAQQQGWVLCAEDVAIGWSYFNGVFIPPAPTDYSQQNKTQATSLLQQTDWTCTVDITNSEYSNPYLGNQNEFLEYRSKVRQIAVNPPSTLAVFPDMPNEVWIDA